MMRPAETLTKFHCGVYRLASEMGPGSREEASAIVRDATQRTLKPPSSLEELVAENANVLTADGTIEAR